MSYMNLLKVFLIMMLVLIASCTTPTSRLSTTDAEPVDFETGIGQLTHRLLKQAETQLTQLNSQNQTEKSIVIDPFMTANKGEILATLNRRIEIAMLEQMIYRIENIMIRYQPMYYSMKQIPSMRNKIFQNHYCFTV
jgi:hypothetical protein